MQFPTQDLITKFWSSLLTQPASCMVYRCRRLSLLFDEPYRRQCFIDILARQPASTVESKQRYFWNPRSDFVSLCGRCVEVCFGMPHGNLFEKFVNGLALWSRYKYGTVHVPWYFFHLRKFWSIFSAKSSLSRSTESSLRRRVSFSSPIWARRALNSFFAALYFCL